MSENNIFNDDQEEDFDILGFIFKYLRYWYWFVLTVTLSFAGAYVYIKYYTPIYKVNATLLIKDEKLSKPGIDMMEEFSAVGSKQMDNEIEVLRSRSLVGKVIDNLNLTVSYWKETRSRDRELYLDSPIKINIKESINAEPFYIQHFSDDEYFLLNLKKENIGKFDYSQLIKSSYGQFRVFRNKEVPTLKEPVKVVFQSREGLVNQLVGSLQIAPLSYSTSFISLGLETAIPEKGKAILSKLLEEYAFNSLEDKNREATNTLRFIEERLKLVTSELGDVEQDVEQYRRAQGITDLGSEASLFLGKVEENDSKINELDVQAKVLEGVEGYINNTEAGNLAPATLMVNDPVLSGYISQYAQLEAERSKLARSVQPGNPLLETVNGQMKNVKQAIRENIANQKNNLSVSRNNLYRLNNRLESSISTIPRKEREYVGIKRQAGIKENLYLLLFQKREETALSYASTVTDSRVVDVPYSTGGPIRPVKNNIYMFALLLGLGLPMTVLFLKEILTNTVQSKKQIEQKTGMKVFGEMSLRDTKETNELIDFNGRSFLSEQVRMIRSNLQYLLTDSKPGVANIILITSSTGNEGKSFVSLNIANSLAIQGKKVIVLGFDLRKPKLNEYLDLNNKKGLSNFLIGKAQIEQIIQKTKLDNVFSIPSGPIPPNPAELIGNGKIKELFEVLKQTFDYILIDTAPMGLVTDATLLAPYADIVFYIVRHQKTSKQFLSFIADINKRNIFKSMHLIFNGVNHKNSAEYGFGYGYGYEYGNSYFLQKQAKKPFLKGLFSKK